MTDHTVQIVSILVSATLLLVVLDLVRRRKLTEEYSFIWIFCALGLLALSIWRGSLDAAARWLGVFYPPALLLLVLFFFVFVASLYFSVVISRQREQIERLIEEMAILGAEQRRARQSTSAPGGVVAQPITDYPVSGYVRRQAASRGTALGVIFGFAALIPPLLALLAVIRFSVNLPFEDDWDALGIVALAREGTLSLGALFDWHNEHRIFAVRTILLVLGQLTNANVVADMVVGLGFAMLTLACTWGLIRDTVGRAHPRLVPVLTFVCSLVLFWGSQHSAWLWAFVSIEWFLTNLVAVGLVWAFTRWPGRWRGLVLGLLCATVATMTLASGVMLWVVGALAIVAGPAVRRASAGASPPETSRGRFLAVWVPVAVIVVLASYWGLKPGLGGAHGRLLWLSHPGEFGEFILTSLGLLWGGTPVVSARMGVLGILFLIIACCVLLGRRQPFSSMVPWLLLATYALLASALIAVGRLPAGVGAALAPRYATGSVLFWIGVLVLAGFALGAGTRPGDERSWRAVVAATLIVILCGAYVAIYRRAYSSMARNSHDREFALADLYAEGGPTQDTLLFLYPPGVELARARVERFTRLHLGPFAPGMRATGERLAAEMRPAAQPRDVQGTH